MEHSTFTLDLENFQSISKASFSFDPGITAIIGRSDSGKTAIFRALRGLIYNPNGSKHYIKHHKDAAKVTLHYGDKSLTWERKKSSSNYYFNGEEHLKASKYTAHDVDRSFPMLLDGNKALNMQTEWDVLFPFDKSDTELFKLFENIFNISDSAKIIASMKMDISTLNKDISELSNNKISNENKIRAIEELLENIDTNDIEIYIKHLEESSRLIQGLQNDINGVSKLQKILNTPEIAALRVNDDIVAEIQMLDNDMGTVDYLLKMIQYDSLQPMSVNNNIANDFSILHSDYTKMQKILKDLESEFINNKSDIARKADIEKELAKIKVCPLCNSNIGEQHE